MTNNSSSALDETEIIKKIQAGENSFFGKILEAYEAKISRYAKRFLRQPEDVKDIVQDIFIKAYRNIESFDPKRKFSSWLYRIAHNECVNFLKKKKLEKISCFDLDVLFPRFACEKYAEEINRQKIKDLLDLSINELNFKYREPMLLYYMENFDYQEISDILKIPINTVGVRLNRGKKLLKDQYKKFNDD
jgi:RNA polymerase sigma-70 factor, ECF subfamily